jgi:hypothetical protein
MAMTRHKAGRSSRDISYWGLSNIDENEWQESTTAGLWDFGGFRWAGGMLPAPKVGYYQFLTRTASMTPMAMAAR